VNKPQHKDRVILSKIVSENDNLSETTEVDALLSEHLDSDSAAYVAIQRALRMLIQQGRATQESKISEIAFDVGPLGAMWMDGLLAGIKYQKGKENES